MKILIATGIYPPDIGGPATMLEKMAGALKEKDFEVRVLTYSENINKTELGENGDGNDVVRIAKAKIKIVAFLAYFFKMLKMSRWADVVYVTDIYSVGYFAYLIKKITGRKYIVRFAGDSAWEIATGRGWMNDYIVDFQKKTYGSRIEKLKERRKRIMMGADGVIAVSEFLAGIAEMIGVKKENISVIYNSVDFAEKIDAQKITEIKNKYGKGAKIIVTACRLVPWKGVAGVIKIIPALIKKAGNVVFLVLGDGGELENLKKLAGDLGVAEQVLFLGKISNAEIINYFAAADLFILNTNYEGLSHTILEAMLAGAPVVSTTAGGNPETVENGKEGLLVEYNNEGQLLEASARVLIDGALADSFRRNAKEKLKMFRWNDTVEKTILVIKKTVGEQ